MAKSKKGKKASDLLVDLNEGVDTPQEPTEEPTDSAAVSGQNFFYYDDGSVSNVYDRTKVLHREGGPAIEFASGRKEYYQNKRRHRVDGPAIETETGEKYWFINGNQYTEEEYKQAGGK